ncbi:citrate lyase acyl carrier protein [Iocasia frigidifontis]|uniref:Citrate lyase acyl carrier protein n=1 Tax=Iocasia fonsfrigidae TaxID=2682810 RepID=A0A8A7KDS9_9FIRM|nr:MULTISPECIES: citrate lyase acyl carrier protein [Halanaerobiaceae]AZO94856.1 citrate lyase acyl carrier protein [Halocella sp. SP3-1]QTL97768.1 citrate lyase acyl carrier protein [Iocasia fonsfrigidae]
MKIKNAGMAGTLESSDINILIENNDQKGIEIDLKSIVQNQFGTQIKKVIQETLENLGITDAIVHANDKGALDCTIKARVLTAVYRAANKTDYKWEEF